MAAAEVRRVIVGKHVIVGSSSNGMCRIAVCEMRAVLRCPIATVRASLVTRSRQCAQKDFENQDLLDRPIRRLTSNRTSDRLDGPNRLLQGVNDAIKTY